MRPFRFLLVGGLNTLLGILTYGGLLRMGAPYPIASGVSLVLGILIGFQAHQNLVFRQQGFFLRYFLVWTAILGFANLFIGLTRGLLGTFLAGVAAMPINALLGYWALQRFVFRGPGNPAPCAINADTTQNREPPDSL